jgi:hypothetical protein
MVVAREGKGRGKEGAGEGKGTGEGKALEKGRRWRMVGAGEW